MCSRVLSPYERPDRPVIVDSDGTVIGQGHDDRLEVVYCNDQPDINEIHLSKKDSITDVLVILKYSINVLFGSFH